MKLNQPIIIGLSLLGSVALLWLALMLVMGTRNEEGVGLLAGLATLVLGPVGLIALICGIVRAILKATA